MLATSLPEQSSISVSSVGFLFHSLTWLTTGALSEGTNATYTTTFDKNPHKGTVTALSS